MIIKTIIIQLLFVSLSAHAITTVEQIEVKGDLVIFTTTEPKVASGLSCVDNEKSALWALPLTTNHEQEMYALLLSALAANSKVNITSANDCNETVGHERALAITIIN